MMNKDAIQYIQETAIRPEERILEHGHRLFGIDNEGVATELHEREQKIVKECLTIHTLTGLVDYIKANRDRENEPLFLHVKNERIVELKGLINVDGNRENLIKVEAIIPNFSFNSFYDNEELNIALQSVFVHNDDRNNLLKVIGNIADENTRTIGDDGVSQSVVVKTGTTTRSNLKVPNPVKLAPYRTFIEVKQPKTQYVFRMREGGRGALFEADGGAWRNDAIKNVSNYLANELEAEIKSGRITILA